MQTYAVDEVAKAKPSSIYALLLDGRSWPSWMGVDSVEIKRKDAGLRPLADEERVGDVRRIQTGTYVNHEEILELIPNQKFAYRILDGMLLDYKGVVEIVSLSEDRTMISWSGSFRMKVPGAAWLMRVYLARFMQRAVNNLARLAEAKDSHTEVSS